MECVVLKETSSRGSFITHHCSSEFISLGTMIAGPPFAVVCHFRPRIDGVPLNLFAALDGVLCNQLVDYPLDGSLYLKHLLLFAPSLPQICIPLPNRFFAGHCPVSPLFRTFLLFCASLRTSLAFDCPTACPNGTRHVVDVGDVTWMLCWMRHLTRREFASKRALR